MRKIQSLGSRMVAISLMLLLNAPLALAQAGTSGAPSQQDQPAQTEPAETSNQQEELFGAVSPVMAKRVGIDPNQILRLSLHDAILLALQNNNDIQVERTNVQIADYNLESLKGAFDFFFAPSIQWNSDTRPLAQPNFSIGPDGLPIFSGNSSSNQTLSYGFSLSQQLPWWGTAWRLTSDNRRTLIKTASPLLLNPFYTSQLRIEVTQPLLRNFHIDQTRSQIRIQQKAINLSDSLFRQKVIDIITQVQRAYWDLVFAIRAVEIRQEALDLAKTNLEDNRKKVEAGTVAPIDLAQSEAQVEQERQNLIAAIGNVTVAENTLKGLVIGDPDAPEWKANIAPTESIGHLAPVIDFESATKLALANRPELEQLRFQKEQKDIETKYLKNQTLPEVNLTASYATNGLKGSIVQSRLESFFPNIEPGEIPPEFRSLSGGPGDAFGQTFGNDFRSLSFGVSMNIPLRNRTARANLGRARAERRSLDFQENRLVQFINTEVRNALQNVQTARQQIEAARAARIARQTQLDGEQKKFEAGLSTTFFVLQFQNSLSEARLAELQALVNYNKAIADLQRVMSTTLSANNVQITVPNQK